MPAVLTVLRPRAARLSEVHAGYLLARIHHHRKKAADAFAAAGAARAAGNEPLALGLLDAAAAYHAIAQGLAEQSCNTREARS
ncbi:MAG TPA: hypothetical protein VGL55_16510 [Steroidobacteraceae bacterium]